MRTRAAARQLGRVYTHATVAHLPPCSISYASGMMVLEIIASMHPPHSPSIAACDHAWQVKAQRRQNRRAAAREPAPGR